jgi:glycosyltransferase involved in cell wall biosynthesis
VPIVPDAKNGLTDVRIVLLPPSLGLGGAERQAFLLGRYLSLERGALVRVVTFGPVGPYADACDRWGIPWEHFGLVHRSGQVATKIADLWRFVALLRRRRAEVLLPFCMFQNVLGGLAWRMAGARTCVWNQRDEGRGRVTPVLERLAIRQVPVFIANSQHGATFLTDVLRVPRARVHTIHNGVELPGPARSRTEWRESVGVPPGAFCAVMVANLHGFKDHLTLVEAWDAVVRRLEPAREAHLFLAGLLGDQYQPVSRRTSELGLQGRVHFLGQVEDVAGLLGASDLAVFSSRAEGVPNGVLEAMAAGLAVVATDYPGIREAVGDAGQRLLAPPRDARALAERVVTAAEDASLRASQGAAGRERINCEFSVEQMGARTGDLVLSALG